MGLVGPDPDENIDADFDFEDISDDDSIEIANPRLRFRSGETSETVPYGWPERSLGWKLERSQVEYPPGERPMDILTEQTEKFVASVKAAVDRSVQRRRQRLL